MIFFLVLRREGVDHHRVILLYNIPMIPSSTIFSSPTLPLCSFFFFFPDGNFICEL